METRRGTGRETRSKEKTGPVFEKEVEAPSGDREGGGGEGADEGGRFLLGPIKKPVSSSVSESLLWHSRQLRKHLKAPEKPDNTSLVESPRPARRPPRLRTLSARCSLLPLAPRASPSLSLALYLSILCIKHRVPFPSSAGHQRVQCAGRLGVPEPRRDSAICALRLRTRVRDSAAVGVRHVFNGTCFDLGRGTATGD